MRTKTIAKCMKNSITIGFVIFTCLTFLSYSMMTSSNGNIFRVTGPLCGEFTGPGEFPTQRSVTRSFDVFFDLRLNERLNKQQRGWWFETLSWSLWRHCNGFWANKKCQDYICVISFSNFDFPQYCIVCKLPHAYGKIDGSRYDRQS